MELNWRSFRKALVFLWRLSVTSKAILLIYGVCQTLQFFDILDPVKGYIYPLPQFGAVMGCLIGLGTAQGFFKDPSRFPANRLQRHLIGWILATFVALLLSFNLYYRLPENWFFTFSEARWLLTMVTYWVFAIALGVTVAGINANKKR